MWFLIILMILFLFFLLILFISIILIPMFVTWWIVIRVLFASEKE